jgi:hypothetical protein
MRLARAPSSTTLFSNSRSVQRVRPLGALEQARAIQLGFLFAVEKCVTRPHRRARERLHDRTHAQKNRLKPHRRQCWVIPPKANSAFVAAMEDVLAVYMRPRDSDRVGMVGR